MSDPTVVLEDVHVTYHIAGGGRRLRGMFSRSRVDRSPRLVRAVRGVSLATEKGETVGLIGRNGSGKSSLLRAAAGLLPVTSGSIQAVAHPALLGVGAALKPDSTGRQNVLLGASAMGLDRREILERMEEILEFAGLQEAADQPFGTYSSGMKARLQFAVATATRPQILMIDEALAVGDEEFRERSQERIRELLDGASTVFLVSHALLEIERRCDRVLWLEKGEQVQWGPAEEVVSAYREDMAARRAAAHAGSDEDASAPRAQPRRAAEPVRRPTREQPQGPSAPEDVQGPSPSEGAWERSRAAVDERLVALEAEAQRLRAHLANVSAQTPTALPGPIFLGGASVGMSRMLARVLGRHPDVEPIPTQLRFHAANGGFRPVLDERESPEQFADRVRTRYFDARGTDGRPKGLAVIAQSRDMSRAERQLLALAGVDLVGGLRSYMNTLVSPYANGRGAVTWVETTPDNVVVADCLHAVFPHGHVIHVVRDGRDVVADVLAQPWGPETVEDALAWWANLMRAADRAATGADPARLRVVRYEDLLTADPEEHVPELLRWLGLSEVPGSGSWFSARTMSVTSEVGHWRSSLSAEDASRVDSSYEDLYAQLSDEGIECLPAPPDQVDVISQSAVGTGPDKE